MAELGQLAWLCSDNVHGRAWTVCVAGKQNRVLLRETSLPRGPVRRRQLPARVWNTPAPLYEYRPLHAASPSSAKRRRTSSLVRHLGWRGTNFSSFFFQRSPWVFLLLLLPCFPSVCGGRAPGPGGGRARRRSGCGRLGAPRGGSAGGARPEVRVRQGHQCKSPIATFQSGKPPM